MSSHLNAAQNYPIHMYKETFLPFGVAIATLQRKLWPYQIRIVMPYGFINYDLAQNKCNLSCLDSFYYSEVLWLVGLIYESSQQKLG